MRVVYPYNYLLSYNTTTTTTQDIPGYPGIKKSKDIPGLSSVEGRHTHELLQQRLARDRNRYRDRDRDRDRIGEILLPSPSLGIPLGGEDRTD